MATWIDDLVSGGKKALTKGVDFFKDPANIAKYGLPSAAAAYNIFGRDPVLPQNPIYGKGKELTPLGSVLTKQAEEGIYTPGAKRRIMGVGGSNVANMAQNTTAETRSRLASTGHEGSIAGVRALNEPTYKAMDSIAQQGVGLERENAASKQSANTEIASLLTDWSDRNQQALTAEDNRRNDSILQYATWLSTQVQNSENEQLIRENNDMWQNLYDKLMGGGGGDNGKGPSLDIDWGNIDLWPDGLLDKIRNLNPRLDFGDPSKWTQDIWNMISGFGGPSSFGEYGVRSPIYNKGGGNDKGSGGGNNPVVTTGGGDKGKDSGANRQSNGFNVLDTDGVVNKGRDAAGNLIFNDGPTNYGDISNMSAESMKEMVQNEMAPGSTFQWGSQTYRKGEDGRAIEIDSKDTLDTLPTQKDPEKLTGFFKEMANVGKDLLIAYVIKGFFNGAKDFYGQEALSGIKRRGFSEKMTGADEVIAQAAVFADPQNESIFSGKSSGELVKYFGGGGSQNKNYAQGGMNDINKMFGTAELAKTPGIFKQYEGGMSVKDLQTLGAESATSKRFIESKTYYSEFVSDLTDKMLANGQSPADVAARLKVEEAKIVPLMTRYIDEGGQHPRDVIGQQANTKSFSDVMSAMSKTDSSPRVFTKI